MSPSQKTVLHQRHLSLGARMVEFGGWDMPLHYPAGIIQEHLQTRRSAGLFDVSHMGRFAFRGRGAAAFLQQVLTNDAAALPLGRAQYTIVPSADGGAIDDAYLYRFVEDSYLLVVNAANRRKDWEHFRSMLADFGGVEMLDRSEELAMLSLQGPRSTEILLGVSDSGGLPGERRRNALFSISVGGVEVLVGRTGYTGEPGCFELFIPRSEAERVWDLLLARGAAPVGLGARDTLRLEAALPLYGHEFGADPEGVEIPVFASPLARFAVSFSAGKGEFVGKAALTRQSQAVGRIARGEASAMADLPRIIRRVAILDRAVARAGARVLVGQKHVGYVTSGTAVPYWEFDGQGLAARPSDQQGVRSIALALVDSTLRAGQDLAVEVRGRPLPGRIVERHLRSDAPPYARPVVHWSAKSSSY